MRSKFDEQLRLLNQEMMYMGTMIEDSIQKAIEALIAQNAQLAEKIMNSDSDVDHEQKKIENICFNLLMQQQPVARDLRVISAAMKMVTDMERIGDHAADISEITIMLSKEPYVLNLDDIKKMASETVIMLIRSIEAYVEKDMNKAQEVIRHDDIVDDLFDKNKADIIELIRHDPEKGEQAADMLMVAKYFERIGDHATNIAEWVIFALNDKKEIKESGIVILQFPNGVEYGDSTVYLVIGIAGKDNEHLDILSKIAISLDDELVEKLKDSTDVNDFLNIFA
jgi:phosphate transport system protein